LSDIAAMGGEPRWFLLSLGLPEWSLGAWVKHYIYGMFQLARQQEVACVGGDVARGERFTADVCVVGAAPAGRFLTRSGARIGDAVYVSGSLGGAARGLALLAAGASARNKSVYKHLYPQPRLALGEYLLGSLRASAAIDLSDGLSRDAERLALASEVCIELDASAIPVSPRADFEEALHGGEDYELLFTVSPRRPVPETYGGLPLSRIGRVTRGRGLVIRRGAARTRVRQKGFEHFGPRR
jgi:thiamine-monophosphate kinase